MLKKDWYKPCRDPHHHHYFMLTLLDGESAMGSCELWAFCQHPPAIAHVGTHACTFMCITSAFQVLIWQILPHAAKISAVLGIKCTLHHIPVLLPEMLSGALSGCCVLHPAPSRSTFCAASMCWPYSHSYSLFITLTETLSS